VSWDGDGLTIAIDEIGTPLPRRVRGTVKIRPEFVTDGAFDLDPAGRHQWWPIAPRSRIEVRLEHPAQRWEGAGYLDCNAGSEPLENAFTDWTWARAAMRQGAGVVYDVGTVGAGRHGLALRFGANGSIETMPSPERAPLQSSRWLLPQETRSDRGAARVVRRLEDAPFYARSLVAGSLFGEPVTMMHETLSLTRFASPIVKLMLPFRMPRN
jgi:carotenoid 1,2-hydratase